jgi:hypothetical protein
MRQSSTCPVKWEIRWNENTCDGSQPDREHEIAGPPGPLAATGWLNPEGVRPSSRGIDGVKKSLRRRGKQKADEGTRTPDLLITSELLYQLSYVGPDVATPDATGSDLVAVRGGLV